MRGSLATSGVRGKVWEPGEEWCCARFGGRTLLTVLGAALVALPTTVRADGAVFRSSQWIEIEDGAICGDPVYDQFRSVPYGTSVEVPAPPRARVTSARVTLHDFTVPLTDGVRILLTSPAGTGVILMDGVGGSMPGASKYEVTFDDAAPDPVPAVLTPGTFRPRTAHPCPKALPAPAPQTYPYRTELAAVSGEPAAGTWRLFVASWGDVNGSENSAHIGGWSLDLDWAEPPVCAPVGPLDVPHRGRVTVRFDCTDPEGGDALTYAVADPPAHGTLGAIDHAAGTVTYTPRPGYSGVDSFTYTGATAAGGQSEPTRVRLHVAPEPVPDPPAAPQAPGPVAGDPEPPAAAPLAPASLIALRGGTAPRTRIVQRLGLSAAGRYTLILRDAVTGRRLRWLPGSRVGTRTLRRASSAPVLTTTAPDRRVTVTARVAPPAGRIRAGRVQLRVVLKRPDRPLTDAVIPLGTG